MQHVEREIIRASAGTGKTTALVERYVRLIVEQKLNPEDIVAVTFTRRAANELRERIVIKLEQDSVSPLILEQLPHARIGTFHELALELLRELSDGNEDARGVLEGSEGGRLFVEVAKQTWLEARGPLREALVATLAHLKLDDEFIGALGTALMRCREAGLPIQAGLVPCDEPSSFHQDVHARLVAAQQRAQTRLDEVKDEAQKEALTKFCAYTPHPAEPDCYALWGEGWIEAMEPLEFGKIGKLGKVDTDLSTSHWHGLSEDVCTVLAEYAAAQARAPLEVLVLAAHDAYEAAKHASNSRDFVDLILAIVQRLEEDPDAHRFVRSHVRAVLIDEAQDTNALQVRFVRLLAGLDGPVAAHVPSAPAAAHLVIVGDPKQSIYGFRGADRRNFEHLADEVAALGGKVTTLSTSFRSSAPLVASINSLSQSAQVVIDESEKLVAATDAQWQRSGRTPPNSMVPAMRWWALDKERDDSKARYAEAIATHVERLCAAGYAYEQIAILMRGRGTFAAILMEVLNRRGIPVMTDGTSGLWQQAEVRDVMATIAWIADEERLLDAAVALRSPLFGLTDSTLQQLFGQEEGAADARRLLRAGGTPALAGLSEDEGRAVAWAAAQLERLCTDVPPLSPSAALAHIDRVLDVKALYAAHGDGPQRLANLEQLWWHAAQAQAAGCLGALDFVLEMRRRAVLKLHDVQGAVLAPSLQPAAAAGECKGGGQGAVSLLSIHASKGLQFPAVILARIDAQGGGEHAAIRYSPGDGLLFYSKQVRQVRGNKPAKPRKFALSDQRVKEEEDAELRRLLYVAITRAKECVDIVALAPEECRNVALGKWLKSWATTQKTAHDAVPLLRVLQADDHPATQGSACQPSKAPGQLARLAQTCRVHRPPRGPNRFVLRATQLAGLLAEGGFRLDDIAQRDSADQPVPAALSFQDDTASSATGAVLAAGPQLSSMRLGTLGHQVLRHMDQLDPDADAPSCLVWVDRMLALFGYDANLASLRVLRHSLVHFLVGPTGQRLRATPAEQRFGEYAFCRTVQLGEDRLEVHGQIDLIVVGSQRPWIIDYKSRAPSGSEDTYAYQLALYAWALAERFGVQTQMQADLVYLGEGGRHSRYLFEPTSHTRLQRQITELLRQEVGDQAATRA